MKLVCMFTPSITPEPNEIDADLLCRRSDERDDDEGDLEEIEEEGEEEHQDVYEYEETDLAAGQRGQQMLDPHVAVHAVESQRENTCADQDEHDESGQLRRRLDCRS